MTRRYQSRRPSTSDGPDSRNKKDEPKLALGTPKSPHQFLPKVTSRPSHIQKLNEFNVWPPHSELHGWINEIPYENKKDAETEFSKIGRPVFMIHSYRFDNLDRVVTDGQIKPHFYMSWDYQNGLVRVANLFKACNLKKTIPGRVIKHNDLTNMVYNITGGAIHGQGYWFPYDVAREIALTFCWRIRFALIPLFGADFPDECIQPGESGWQSFEVKPETRARCLAEADEWRRLAALAKPATEPPAFEAATEPQQPQTVAGPPRPSDGVPSRYSSEDSQGTKSYTSSGNGNTRADGYYRTSASTISPQTMRLSSREPYRHYPGAHQAQYSPPWSHHHGPEPATHRPQPQIVERSQPVPHDRNSTRQYYEAISSKLAESGSSGARTQGTLTPFTGGTSARLNASPQLNPGYGYDQILIDTAAAILRGFDAAAIQVAWAMVIQSNPAQRASYEAYHLAPYRPQTTRSHLTLPPINAVLGDAHRRFHLQQSPPSVRRTSDVATQTEPRKRQMEAGGEEVGAPRQEKRRRTEHSGTSTIQKAPVRIAARESLPAPFPPVTGVQARSRLLPEQHPSTGGRDDDDRRYGDSGDTEYETGDE